MAAEGVSIEIPGSGRLFRRLRRSLLRLIGPLIQSWYRRHYSVARLWRWRGLEIEVWPGVFAPALTGSTAFTLDYLQTQALDGKVVAEVGCGTGVLGIQAARQGARVNAADINPGAVANGRANAARNCVTVDFAEGAFLEPFVAATPEIILVSPPYYPKDPRDLAEAAWYCGEDHAYFRDLFEQLAQPPFRRSRTLMNLSEDCELEAILSIARKHGLAPSLAHAKRVWGEWFYVLEFRQS